MPTPITNPRVLLLRTREHMGDARLTRSITDRRSASMSKRMLARATGITPDRLERIITRNELSGSEPMLHEAGRIAQVLGTTIRDLIAQPGERIDWGFDTFDDVEVWRTRTELPLRVAGRLCDRFDIADPLHLYELERARSGIPLLREVWSQYMSNVRLPDTKPTTICSWCGMTISEQTSHRPTCAPAFLFEGRDGDPQALGVQPKVRDPRKRVAGGKMIARGIRQLRGAQGVTQAKLAADLGIHPNYLSQLEVGSKPTTYEMAERIASMFRVTVEQVYAGA